MSIFRENIKGVESKYYTEFSYKEINKLEYRFEFKILSTSKYAKYNGYNHNLYESNVVELFIKDQKEQNRYLELEVAPNNAHFLAFIYIDDNGNRSIRYIDKEYDFFSEILEINNEDIQVNIILDLKKYFKGENFLFNAYRIENEEDRQYLMALNPTLSDTFHKPESFIKL